MNLNKGKLTQQQHKESKASFAWLATVQIGLYVLLLGILLVGTIRDPHFWLTADQRGDQLLAEKKYSTAANAYGNPWRIGAAQYRNGDFEAAAKTFARVPGADGAFDQGNAWLMHGKYDAAIKSYDRALGFRANWKEAEENKALAIARQRAIEKAGENRQESADAYKPDEIVFDQKGDNQKGQPVEMNGEKMSDEELRATWLRRVQTTPADFLQAKFAYQASRGAEPNRKSTTKGGK
jgi:Ca-activated chloride channel family protein